MALTLTEQGPLLKMDPTTYTHILKPIQAENRALEGFCLRHTGTGAKGRPPQPPAASDPSAAALGSLKTNTNTMHSLSLPLSVTDFYQHITKYLLLGSLKTPNVYYTRNNQMGKS